MKAVKQGNSFFGKKKKLYSEPNTAIKHTELEIHLVSVPVQLVTVFPLTGVSSLIVSPGCGGAFNLSP